MKQKTNNKRRWIILNALFLALAVLIAINLYETGGVPAQSPEVAAQPAEATPAPETAQATVMPIETPALDVTPEPEATPAPEVKTGAQDFSMRFVGDLMCCDY